MAFIFGTGASESLTSLAFNNGMEMDVIFGSDGNDNIESFWNDDILDGGSGHDLLFGGQGNDDLAGGVGNDVLSAGAGNDVANGGSGDDFIRVDFGDDIYIGGSGIDTISFENISNGLETEENFNSVTFDLTKTTQNLGVLGADQFFGFENVRGSSGDDRIFGSAGANGILGNDGDDVLYGRTGNDTILGGEGSDVINGGKGNDLIGTGTGTDPDDARDRIDYNSILDSGLTDATRDVIFGFNQGGKATDDKIDLSTIDANPFAAGNQAFKFVSGGFTAQVGEVRCVSSGGDTIIFIDTDRDKGAEMTIKVEDVTGLKAFDFIL